MTVRIEADLLIPGRGEPVSPGVVVLQGPTIEYAGPPADAPETPDASVTKVATVLPGLWECHGHFIGERSPDIEVWAKDRWSDLPDASLESGEGFSTGLRDLGL